MKIRGRPVFGVKDRKEREKIGRKEALYIVLGKCSNFDKDESAEACVVLTILPHL